MKNILILSLMLFSFVSCENEKKTNNTTNTDTHTETPVISDTTTTNTGDATSQVYTCPMHPEVISDKPGKCPKCKMDLVLQSELDAEEK